MRRVQGYNAHDLARGECAGHSKNGSSHAGLESALGKLVICNFIDMGNFIDMVFLLMNRRTCFLSYKIFHSNGVLRRSLNIVDKIGHLRFHFTVPHRI